MEPTQEVWPHRRIPDRYDGQQDREWDHTTLSVFMDSLAATEGQHAQDYLTTAPETLLTTLSAPSIQPSFPINVFDPFEEPPPPEEVDAMRNAFLAHFHPHCLFLRNISTDAFLARSNYLSCAGASVGYFLLGSLPQCHLTWQLAHRSLEASLIMDNRQVRDTNAIVAWLLLGTVGVLSSDPVDWRTTNTLHGIFDTIVKKAWVSSVERVPERSKPTAEDRTSMISYLLLLDTVRSLHFGMPPTCMSSYGNLSLRPDLESLAALLSKTVFGGPKTEWPTFTEENSLLVLLVILNQILLWARKIQPIARSISREPLDPSSVRVGTRRTRIRIERALQRWQEKYLADSPSDIKALFDFCQLHLLIPDLHLLPVLARYEPVVAHATMTPDEAEETRILDADVRSEASHHAWLLLEHVSACANPLAVWLPVIVYLAGLVVWSDITAQEGSRAHGSLRVLLLFQRELRRMNGACCAEMALNLEQLAAV